MKKNTKKAIAMTAGILGAAYVAMRSIAKKQNRNDIYKTNSNEQNPMYKKQVIFVEDENDEINADGKCGHLVAVGEINHVPTFYEKYVKRAIDVMFSFGGMVVLAPVYAATAIAIKIDDPGDAIFRQKRIAEQNGYFTLIKFRSMSKSSDIPTHMLSDGGQSSITRVGKVIRKLSIDELPQLWSIFKGDMSIIGPRPALWNQDWLTSERSKYGANDIKPGLTGLAQISGRDELEIPDKARFDGEYAKALSKSSFSGFKMDCKIFFGSIKAVLKHDGVVEGGTGELDKENDFSDYGYLKHFDIDKTKKIRVLITGANSYIGTSFEAWAQEKYQNIEVDTVDTIDGTWREKDFSSYDAVFHVAGLAHADVGHVDEATKAKYYAVNTALAIEVAEKAKADGVKQFVFMSSMIVYGESADYGKKKCVNKYTVPSPANFYGDSKWQADKGVRNLQSEDFNVAVLRPPMIYGRGSKGNYPTLAKLAKKLPVFPNVNNERSMLHIDNLCEFLCLLMLSGESGVYFPQNDEFTKTADMVKTISHVCEKNIIESKIFNPAVKIGTYVPGKIGGMVNKAFGNMTYDQKLSQYDGMEYIVNDLKTSVVKTEGEVKVKRMLMLASVASMIDQFNMPNIKMLLEMGYEVDVACNFEEGSTCSDEEIEVLKHKLDELGVKYYQIDFTRCVNDLKAHRKSYKQVLALVKERKYTFIHCHSPIGGVIGRMVAHVTGTKVIYTAHGFHFFDGAPRKNWMIYYPIEKYFSKYTDVLITINKEDYARASKEFNMKKIEYIPGVGVDVEKFKNTKISREVKRKELNIPQDAFVLLSVGELGARKNHQVVIDALSKIQDDNIYFVIAGKGELYEQYTLTAEAGGVNLILLGPRDDVPELCKGADVFVHPSVREGLGIAPLEGMASGLPLISSYVNGIKDYTENGISGVCIQKPLDIEKMKNAILKMKNDEEFRQTCIKNNIITAERFSIENSQKIMKRIYKEV